MVTPRQPWGSHGVEIAFPYGDNVPILIEASLSVGEGEQTVASGRFE
jgi:hypothetical protein